MDLSAANKILSQIVISYDYNSTLQHIFQNFLNKNFLLTTHTFSQIFSFKIHQAFSMFLLQCHSYFDKEQFNLIAHMVMIYAVELDEEGWEILEKIMAKGAKRPRDQNDENRFCLENNCEHILEISNNFVTEFLPQELAR